jgi:creatinine amidohydrolase
MDTFASIHNEATTRGPRRYGDLVSDDLPGRLNGTRLVIPVGSVEQHGPHLPLTVDIDIAAAIARELARRLDAYLAESISYGARSLPQSGGGPSFAGTIPVRGATLINYLADIITAYCRAGAKSIVVVNGHYENEPFLFEAMEVCRESGVLDRTQIVALSWWSVVSDDTLRRVFGTRFPGWHAEHAGLSETSLMLYLRPDVVRSERPEHSRPPLAGVYLHPIDPGAISDRGVLASTFGSSSEFGRILFEHICDNLVPLVERPHGMVGT